MLDRKKAPGFKTIDTIEIIPATAHQLDNGIPVYTVDTGTQELSKIEFVFKAGMYYQSMPLMASASNNLMESGTVKYTADEISDNIDFLGSFYETGVGQDFSSVSQFSLNKYLNETLVYVEDTLKNATFPQQELDIYFSNKKQKYLVNSQKVSVLARRRFAELLFGEKHPYGIDVKLEDFDRIKKDHIVDFYHQHYKAANCTIIASGKLPKNLLSVLNGHFGQGNWGDATKIEKVLIPTEPTTQRVHFIEKAEAIQSAIRIGRPLFNKTHPDYFKFQVLNTILGGYFGSRLMANIREDKGYTYGIGSGLNSLVNDGYFFISTEVGADVTQKALDEIYSEIKLLQDELVDEEELETVRNYILGQFLRSVDGPFSLADKFKAIWEFDMGYDYFDRYFAAVKTVTAEEIRDLARKYLQREDLIECVVGKK